MFGIELMEENLYNIAATNKYFFRDKYANASVFCVHLVIHLCMHWMST